VILNNPISLVFQKGLLLIDNFSVHTKLPVSDWVKKWSHVFAPNSRVLDLACGYGRHAKWLWSLKMDVLALDKDQEALSQIQSMGISTLCADLENSPWPLTGQKFDGLVVTNYLWRALWPDLLDCVKEGGFVIYETFCEGHQAYGKPTRADFLLKSAELLDVFQSFKVLGFEEGLLSQPSRYVQRIIAQKPALSGTLTHLAIGSLECTY
jgi:SAM-dependent methyltransferase